MAPQADAAESIPEHNLHVFKECFVYKIPPLKNESGHRANDWDVNKWIWSGRLRIAAADAHMTIYLEDGETGSLFAAAPCHEPGAGPTSVEPVTDSSRYFVLRVEDGKGHHQYVGLGFRERPDAYDFNATLADHWKGVRREREAEETHRRAEEAERAGTAQPGLDLSLKDGQTFTIDLGHKRRDRQRASAAASPRGGEGGLMALKPPPPPPVVPPPEPTPRGAPAGVPAPPSPSADKAPVGVPAPPSPSADKATAGVPAPPSPLDDKVEMAADDFGDFASADADGGGTFDSFQAA